MAEPRGCELHACSVPQQQPEKEEQEGEQEDDVAARVKSITDSLCQKLDELVAQEGADQEGQPPGDARGRRCAPFFYTSAARSHRATGRASLRRYEQRRRA